MDFLVNDLSLYGQYPNAQMFQKAIDCLMNMKESARKFGRDIFCNRNLAFAQITDTQTFPQIIQSFDQNKKRSIMQWLTRTGPFWEDIRMHSPNDYLTALDEIVTDSAIGEAAWCSMNGIERYLVSFAPSRWAFTPVMVDFFQDEGLRKHVDVDNFWEIPAFEAFLRERPLQIDSWRRLSEIAVPKFCQLVFADDAFLPLEGLPFHPGSAQRLMFLFNIIDRFSICFDDCGKRTAEGHEIYKNFFTGKKGDGGKGALFCDSSDSEKRDFKEELTFQHPGDHVRKLFCPWHGKIQTPQLRVHFSWPVRAGNPTYIVYVGPKITKR